jgi:methyl-accepting chemotaxis protein
MQEGGLGRSACLVAVAGTAAIAVIGFSTWRYDIALSRGAVAVRERADATATAALTTAYWHERQAAGLYLAAPGPAARRAVTAQHDEFQRLAAQLGRAGPAVDQRARARAVAANERYLATFRQVSSAAGPTAARPRAALVRLEAAAAGGPSALGALSRSATLRAAAAHAATASAARQARIIGIAAVLVIIAIGNALGAFMLRLLGRALRRARQLMSVLARLGDRDRLLAELRSTSAVLGGVAGELRSAAGKTAAVGSQQSSAVAQTSATIEELAAAAGSIADNVRAVAEAAGQTGRTMRDMQEKVGAIAERAQSLGERAKQIDEILHIISDIAAQTNLLALNATIEAARAGEAGKGFAVVAAEVRALAERSIHSADSIGVIITGVQEETTATITATEQGRRQALEVGELMASMAAMLDESMLATAQQKSAADQVDGAIQQIRSAADHLVAEQAQWSDTAEQLDTLVRKLDSALQVDERDAVPVLEEAAAWAGPEPAIT